MIALPSAAKCCLCAFYSHILPHFADEPSGGGSTPVEHSPSHLRYLAWNKKREETRRLLAAIHEHQMSESKDSFEKGQGRLKDEKMLYRNGFDGDDGDSSSLANGGKSSSSSDMFVSFRSG